MKRQFVLFKTCSNDLLYSRYDTVEEAKASHPHTNKYPGEATAEYDLESDRYIWMKDSYLESRAIREILDFLKDAYKKENELT